MRKSIFLLAVFLITVFPAFALPAADGYFTDLSGRLGDLDAEMERLCLDLDQRTGCEFALLVVPDLDGLTIDDYSEQVFRSWEVGKKDADNGLLFVLSLSERQARLEVGYGLESILPDSLAGNLLLNYAVPSFKQDEWREGIRRLVTAVIGRLTANYEKDARPASRGIMERQSAAATAAAFLTSPAFLILLAVITALFIFNLARFGTRRFIRKYHLAAEILLAAAAVALLIVFYNPGQNGLWILVTALGGGVIFVIQYFMSARHLCPQCRKYMEISSAVISPATYTSTGRRRISCYCPACKYSSAREEVIPRLERTSSGGGFSSGGSIGSGGRSSSSGGFSFGGGSSGGGGASVRF